MKALRAVLRRSIRAKITFLIFMAIIVSILSIGIVSVLSIRTEDENSARHQLTLLSRTEQLKIDQYLNSIQQSVETVVCFADEELNRGDTDLSEHLDHVAKVFHSVAGSTNGAMTYYYRVAPEKADGNSGFWYVCQDGKDYTSAPVVDVSSYNASDMTHVGWYTRAKQAGVPVWLSPYYNANLGMEMISYVAPVYQHGVFFGVVGMDFEFSVLQEQVANITIFQTGYAFLIDADGAVIYHPTLHQGTPIATEDKRLARDNRGRQEEIIRYTQDGVDMRAAWSELSNGMYLYVTAPESEITAGWTQLMCIIIETVAFLLAGFFPVTASIVRRMTTPLSRLSDAAIQMDKGNYDVELDYTGEDEVGILTSAFRQLTDHLRSYIADLNSRAYSDALTSVRNKGAFTMFSATLQDRLNASKHDPPAFAVCMFDCNDLKSVNDRYGHDKGDLYLKNACGLICRTFRHSPVFRVGGDEFAVVLQGDDFDRRQELLEQFDQNSEEISRQAEHPWERVDAAWGIATFEPEQDCAVGDVYRRADERMYERKRIMKAGRETKEESR